MVIVRLFKRAAAMDKGDKAAKAVMKKLIDHMVCWNNQIVLCFLLIIGAQEAHGLTTKALFARMDKSGDGSISGRELAAGMVHALLYWHGHCM